MAGPILARAQRGAKERLMAAAYDLFSRRGVSQVGIDAILAQSGCAKASLYHHFPSKNDLVMAYLRRREALWTRGWLQTSIDQRGRTPAARLLAIFDVFDEWFHTRGFEGCSFINIMLESQPGAVHNAAAWYLSRIRAIVRAQAREAGLLNAGRFADVWHMLMKGCIVAACEGNRSAAREAREAARLILAGWNSQPAPARRRLRDRVN